MCPLDERILELLDERGWASPEFIAGEVRLFSSVERVRERCQMLTEAALIEPMTDDERAFEVTRDGQMYLSGELDARNQPKPPRRLRG
jgi:hypothetical protein